MVIDEPGSYVTITTYPPDLLNATLTTTAALPSNTVPGLVIVEEPGTYTTVTEPYTGIWTFNVSYTTGTTVYRK